MKEGQKNKFEFNLEALRGFAAIVVVISHCFGFSKVLNGSERQGIWKYDFPGHLAVLIFFILSGYVIGISTKNNLTWRTSGLYLKKRILRLYPIYVVGLVAGIIISYNHYSANTIFSNFLFLQRVTAPPMYEVGVIWSLNYEMLFYLLFIPISIYNLRPLHSFIFSLCFGFFFQYVIPIQILAMYGFGFCFWLTGLGLSRTSLLSPAQQSPFTLIGLLFLMLSFSSLNLAHDIIHYSLHLDNMRAAELPYNVLDIMFSDFTYLPIGVLMIISFINKKIRYHSLLITFVLLIPLCYIFFQLHQTQTQSVDFSPKILAYIFYAISLFLLLCGKRSIVEGSNNLPKFMTDLGSISYGIYLIHFIIIILIGRFTFFYGSNFSFFTRTILTLIFTLFAGYMLEKVWHPFAVKQLKKIKWFQQ